MLLAPAFGYLGDRYNRKYIMVGGLAVWIVTTLGSSFISDSVLQKLGCEKANLIMQCEVMLKWIILGNVWQVILFTGQCCT